MRMSKTVLNPIEQISKLFEVKGYEGKEFRLGHIKHDESINDDYSYRIIREKSHDGTFFFTELLIAEALEPLLNKGTYCRVDHTEEEMKDLKDIEYTIGDITLESEYGEVDAKAGKFPGVKQTVYIPVRCKYFFN